MGLTVVSSYFPLPADRGDPVRVLMILRALARAGRFDLLVVRRPDTTDADVERLHQLLPAARIEVFAPAPYRGGRLGPVGRFPEAGLAGQPPWVRTRYSPDLHEALVPRTGAGLALGEAAGAYLNGTSLRWHWDKVNVLAASAREDVAEAKGIVATLRARYLATISTRFEAGALRHATTISVTSDEEAARLLAQHGRKADVTLPSAVELPPALDRRPVDRSLVWLGSFAYPSNLLGLRRFLTEAWDSLHRGGHSLTLVGSGLTETVRAEAGRHPGVRVLGYAPELAPLLAAAQAGVVPLWSGAGVKMKTLTMLAHSVPVFATPVGAEGIPPSPAVRIAPDPDGLARAITAATSSELDGLGAAARAVVEAEFSEAVFADRLRSGLAAFGYLDGPAR